MNSEPDLTTTQNKEQDQKSATSKLYIPLLILNYACLFVGSVSSSLLSKYYFIHKGSSKWVSTFVQSAGFPLLLLPIFIPHYFFNFGTQKPFSHFTPRLFFISISIGFMLGINNLLFSWGVSYLPVSTSALVLSSQLIFNLILSVLIVKQKVTFSNLNTIVLLTLSSVLVALGSSGDKPEGVTKLKYFIGFCCTIGAGLMFAVYLPIMEKLYRQVHTYSLAIEMQLIMEAAATTLAVIGMATDGGFSEMIRESRDVFDKGSTVYWITIGSNIITWQLCFMGTAGMVFLTSSVTSAIAMTALLAVNILSGVIVYGDNFSGIKIVSFLLCIWGFSSYVYGMHLKVKKERKNEKEREKEVERQIMNDVELEEMDRHKGESFNDHGDPREIHHAIDV